MTHEIRNRVEAILFSCGNKINVTTISKIIGDDLDSIRNALLELKKHYESQDTALKIIDENEEWKMSVKENYIGLVRNIVTDTELPKAVLETLAVIAWKAPLLQSDLIHIRNNKAYDHIAELEKSGFINKERFGRSFKIKLAQKFFDYFDVENVEKLRTDLEETADTAEKKAHEKSEKKNVEQKVNSENLPEIVEDNKEIAIEEKKEVMVQEKKDLVQEIPGSDSEENKEEE